MFTLDKQKGNTHYKTYTIFTLKTHKSYKKKYTNNKINDTHYKHRNTIKNKADIVRHSVIIVLFHFLFV